MRQREFQQDLQLSSDAKAALANPVVQQFFTSTRESVHRQWEATAPQEIEAREAAYQMLYMLNKFEAHFKMHVEKEQYAAQQLAEMEMPQ